VLRLVDSNFGNAQVNVFILALILAGARAWMRGHPGAAGIWLGLATALKLVPLFLCVVFLVRRSRTGIASCALSIFSFTILVPSICPGFRDNLLQLERWWVLHVRDFVAGGDGRVLERKYHPGQSLMAVGYRLVMRSPETSMGNEGPAANVLDLDAETATWVVRGAQVAWLGITVASLLRSRSQDVSGARLRELGIAMCGALGLAPLVHKAHMVWLIVPYAILLSGAPWVLSASVRAARWSLVALSLASIGLTTPAIAGNAMAESFLSHDAVFLGLACVFAALLIDVWGARSPSAVGSIRGPTGIATSHPRETGHPEESLRSACRSDALVLRNRPAR
jgi:hypothetical protein